MDHIRILCQPAGPTVTPLVVEKYIVALIQQIVSKFMVLLGKFAQTVEDHRRAPAVLCQEILIV